MKTKNTAAIAPTISNDANVDQIMSVIGAVGEDPEFAKFQFRLLKNLRSIRCSHPFVRLFRKHQQ